MYNGVNVSMIGLAGCLSRSLHYLFVSSWSAFRMKFLIQAKTTTL